MKQWKPANIDLNLDAAGLARAIKQAKHGVATLTNAPKVPLTQIRELMDHINQSKSIQQRMNEAYARTGAEKFVWKDSHAKNTSITVDQKRVLDLAAHRIAAIESAAPELADELGTPYQDSLAFFHGIEQDIVPPLMKALRAAAQNDDIGSHGRWQTAYRMIDYYERPSQSAAPRCGEHRDYGTMTLIFQDGTGGLEVEIDGKWQAMPPSAVVLLFGWCTQVRSNDRIKAALHRVVDSAQDGDTTPRRTAAVLFVAPDADASVIPAVLNGEEAKYRNLKRAGDLKGIMARKWEFREGTLAAHKMAAELEEQRQFKTQDDIVQHVFGK